MNTVFRFAIAIAVFFLLIFPRAELFAQSQKTGYIDSEYVLSKMPDYSGIEQRMSTIVQGWNSEINEMDKKIDELTKDLIAKEILYTEEVRKQKREEISTLKSDKDRFVQAKFGAEGEYYKTQESLLEPIQQKIMLAVRTVAERGNFDFVFDRSGDFLFLYTKSIWNLSDQVLKELGIDVESKDQ
jgi:outer membrane protein